jgi:hypothetical protein
VLCRGTDPADAAHEPLGDRVRSRGADRRLDDPSALCAEHVVEAGGEPRSVRHGESVYCVDSAVLRALAGPPEVAGRDHRVPAGGARYPNSS